MGSTKFLLYLFVGLFPFSGPSQMFAHTQAVAAATAAHFKPIHNEYKRNNNDNNNNNKCGAVAVWNLIFVVLFALC